MTGGTRENATQRGNAGTALAGSVAAAIRFFVKAVMTGCYPEIRSAEIEAIRGHLTGDRGLGEPIINEFLKGVPGLNKAQSPSQG